MGEETFNNNKQVANECDQWLDGCVSRHVYVWSHSIHLVAALIVVHLPKGKNAIFHSVAFALCLISIEYALSGSPPSSSVPLDTPFTRCAAASFTES